MKNFFKNHIDVFSGVSFWLGLVGLIYSSWKNGYATAETEAEWRGAIEELRKVAEDYKTEEQ